MRVGGCCRYICCPTKVLVIDSLRKEQTKYTYANEVLVIVANGCTSWLLKVEVMVSVMSMV